MTALRMLNSSEVCSRDTRMVFKISRPASTACVLWGEISNEAIGSPVLWVIVWEAPGLSLRSV